MVCYEVSSCFFSNQVRSSNSYIEGGLVFVFHPSQPIRAPFLLRKNSVSSRGGWISTQESLH